MIIASRLFMAMGLFGLTAGAIYYLTNDNPELAGVGLLGAFFAACRNWSKSVRRCWSLRSGEERNVRASADTRASRARRRCGAQHA